MLELHTINKKQIGIIGNLNIDLIIRNVPNLPEWGREVLGEDYDIVSAGQLTYMAFALQRLGQSVKIIGNIGEDLYGQKILGDLQRNGINIEEIETVVNSHTGISIAFVRPDGERAFVSDPGCLRQFTYDFVKRHFDYLVDCDLVCMVGVSFIPGITLPEVHKLILNIKSWQKTILLDTGWDVGNWQPKTIQELTTLLRDIDIFIPNMDEAKAITGFEDPQKAAETLYKAGPRIVIIKLGSEGSFLYTNSIQLHVPALKVNAKDAVGAGDVFNAGFIHAYEQNWPLPACIQFGNSVSAIYISRTKDRFPNIVEAVNSANSYNEFLFIS